MDVDESANDGSTFQKLLPRLLKKLEKIVTSDVQKSEIQLIELLSAVCLQAMLGYVMPRNVQEIFEKVLQATNYWSQYRIARSASR